jgi:hypothetical protein
MKAKALLLGLGLVAVAMGAQDTIRFSRAFKMGDSDAFKLHVLASTPVGDVEVNATMKQTISKVYPNGEADLITSVPDMRVSIGGNEAPPRAIPDATAHVGKDGMPVSTADGRSGNMDFSKYAYLFFNKDFKVGDTINIDSDDTKLKTKTTGTAKFESVANGEAKIVETLKVAIPKVETPLEITMTTYVDTASSRLNKVEGTLTNVPAGGGMPPVSNLSFSLERIK